MSTVVSGNLIVYLDAKTSGLERGLSKSTSLMDSFKHSMSVAAGVMMRDFVRGLSSSFAESLKLGGSIETLRNSFNSLSTAAGGNVSSLEDMRTATMGMVSDVDLLTQANNALSLGLPTEDLDELMGSAIKLGKAMGVDAASAVRSLTTGIGRQSRLILDNLGIVFRAEEAYNAYAVQLGVTSAELDEAQKKEAWMAFALEQVREKAEQLGDNISETDKKQARWNATLTNAKTKIGEFLKPLGQFLPIVNALAPAIGTLAVQILPKLIAKLGALFSAQTLANVATTIWHALSGPIGWALLAVAAGVAVAALAWVKYSKSVKEATKAVKDFPESTSVGGGKKIDLPPDIRGLLEAENVPGFQRGGRFRVTRPTLFAAGERGPETVTVTPEGQAPPGALPRMAGPSRVDVHFHIRGEFTEETYRRIRPILQEDLKNVIIDVTSRGSPTDKILLKNVR